jgi:hypothetical protein
VFPLFRLLVKFIDHVKNLHGEILIACLPVHRYLGRHDRTGKASMSCAGVGWLPIGNLPVGLITWYAPGGAVMVLGTSWLGVIGGHPPELRAGCCVPAAGPESLPAGADFAVNILGRAAFPVRPSPVPKGVPGGPLVLGANSAIIPGHAVRAPLLAECALQIECSFGRLLADAWEAVLAGDVRLLHRGGQRLDPADYADFCALHPLRIPATAAAG